ncbi:L,D-transpeptidase [Salinisphaera orenii]|uniref:L,D-transpeptidase n=1 Tax=Salinisphaera orenii TaxID=856731 RepID=UPI00296E67AC
MSSVPRITIDLGRQRLTLEREAVAALEYPVSTAARGAGERNGSNQTPRGTHRIRARIGDGAPIGTVFKGRRPTGEIYSEALAAEAPRRDWILTRILWLCGCEPGVNRFGDVDTMRRYIYIHGMPDSVDLGQPGSIGCIRMRNVDVIDLFDRVPVGTPVDIHE